MLPLHVLLYCTYKDNTDRHLKEAEQLLPGNLTVPLMCKPGSLQFETPLPKRYNIHFLGMDGGHERFLLINCSVRVVVTHCALSVQHTVTTNFALLYMGLGLAGTGR